VTTKREELESLIVFVMHEPPKWSRRSGSATIQPIWNGNRRQKRSSQASTRPSRGAGCPVDFHRGSSRSTSSPGHDQTAGFETAQGFGQRLTRVHAGEISQHAIGSGYFLAAIPRLPGNCLIMQSVAPISVQQMDQPGINKAGACRI